MSRYCPVSLPACCARREKLSLLGGRAGVGAALLFTVVFASHAQDKQLRELDPVVVSATALPITEATVNQHVTVFTREQIEREAPGSIAEFLMRRAGLIIDRTPRSGSFGSLFLRGADPSHVVVLIDGVRQNDPLSSRGSAVDLNTLTLGDIERIEVVRGSASVAHAEALAGVVHLFTRSRTPHHRASLEGGGRGLTAVSASIAQESFQASVTQRQDGEQEDVGSSRTRAANLHLSRQWGPTRLQAQLRVANSRNFGFPDDSGGPRYAVLRTLEERRAQSMQFALAAQRDLADAGMLSLQVVRFENDTVQNSPGVAPGARDPFGLPRMTADGDYRRNELQGEWRREAASGFETLLGAGRREERGTLSSTIFLPTGVPANFALRRITNSLFAEVRHAFGPVTAHAGLRYEHTPGTGSHRHPSLGLQYQSGTNGSRFGAALSSASKLPSFYALGHPLVGNPDLRPERSRQVEVYYATPDASVWKARATLFRARYRDLVDFEAGPPPRLVNRASIEASGLELAISREWTGSFRTYGQATVMRLREEEGMAPLRHRPRRWAHVGADVRLPPNWILRGGLTYVGERADSSIPTGDMTLAGYWDTNLSLSWQAASWEAFAAVDNVFDRRAEETVGTDIIGRRLRAGLRLRF